MAPTRSDRGLSGAGSESLQIFINYRRGDAPGYAGRLYDALTGRFGAQSVFMDVDTLGPGERFREVIERYVSASDALIVLIGRDWASAMDNEGRRRLDDPMDILRLEIEAALARDILVVPTLVDGATMPRPADLPPELEELTHRQSLSIGDGPRWPADVETLVAALERCRAAKGAEGQVEPPHVGPGSRSDLPSRSSRRLSSRRVAVALVALLLAAAAALAGGFFLTRGTSRESTPALDTTMHSSSKSFPDAIENELLLAHVPREFRERCARSRAVPAGVFLRGVACQLPKGEGRVEYKRAHSGDALRVYFRMRVKQAGTTFPTSWSCAGRRPAATEWRREGFRGHVEGRSRHAEGRILCYSRATTAWIVWTDAPTKILAIASGPASAWRRLYASWRQEFGPVRERAMAGMATEGPYPDALEHELLLDHVPPGIRTTCRRTSDFDRDVFLRAVTCSQGARGAKVTYSYAHSGTAMRAYSDSRITRAGLELTPTASCAKDATAASTWMRVGDIGHRDRARRDTGGRILCFVEGRSVVLEWTDNSTGIYAVAARPLSARRSLYLWWTRGAGPGPLEMGAGMG